MKYKINVTGKYTTRDAIDDFNATEIALHHFHTELQRWSNGKEQAKRMWDIEVKRIDDDE